MRAKLGLSVVAIGLGLGLALAANAAWAQPKAPAPKLPILEPTSYALIRLDLQRFDPAAFGKSMDETIASVVADPEQRQQLQVRLQPAIAQMSEFKQAMIQAGAPVLYLSFSDFPPGRPMSFAPLAPNGDAETVRSILNSGKPKGPKGPDVKSAQPMQTVTVAMPDGVFMGRAQEYRRISQPHAGAPYLLFALSAAPEAMVQGVAAPSVTANPVLEATLPQLPPPIDMPMTTVTQGVASIVATFQGPPHGSARFVIQAADAASAAQVKLLVERLLSMLATPQIQQEVPREFELPALAAALAPRIEGDQIIIEPNSAQSERIMVSPLLMPAMAKLKQDPLLSQSMDHTRKIVAQIVEYGNQNQGTLPETLSQLAAARFDGQLPSNPRTAAGQQPGYIYVRSAEKLGQVKKNAIWIYENPQALRPGTNQIVVGDAMGHVATIPIDQLKQRLAAQGADLSLFSR